MFGAVNVFKSLVCLSEDSVNKDEATKDETE